MARQFGVTESHDMGRFFVVSVASSYSLIVSAENLIAHGLLKIVTGIVVKTEPSKSSPDMYSPGFP